MVRLPQPPRLIAFAANRPKQRYYTVGVRYLAMFQHENSGALRTRILLVIDGADVLVGGAGGASMTAATYHRFFEGVPARVADDAGFATLTVDRVPLSVMLRAITALRTGELPPIVPPDTGSAGLASGR